MRSALVLTLMVLWPADLRGQSQGRPDSGVVVAGERYSEPGIVTLFWGDYYRKA